MNIGIRRFREGDKYSIVDVINKTSHEVNIKDYPKDDMDTLMVKITPEFVIQRANNFHMYVVTDADKIIGVGAVGPYWDSLTESSLFNIFILPDYEGLGLGKKLVDVLEQDEYFKRADRVEIPSSITALEFYRHMGYGFKKFGNITDSEGHYKLEKYPKISSNNNNMNQYNMRSYINNEWHNYYDFIYDVKKDSYKGYVEEIWGLWDDSVQRELFAKFIGAYKDNTYIIQLSGEDIGFYNGEELEDGSYEIGNICIKKEYQGRGIGT